MQTYTFNTGRTYEGKQTLVISHRDIAIDEDLLDWVEVSFSDAARNIKGVVSLMVCQLTTRHETGRAVLFLYDSGEYKNI